VVLLWQGMFIDANVRMIIFSIRHQYAREAAGGNLMVLCFGMNDNAVSTLYANMLGIITQVRAAGMDVVVIPIPRTPSTQDSRYSLTDWRYKPSSLLLYCFTALLLYCFTAQRWMGARNIARQTG